MLTFNVSRLHFRQNLPSMSCRMDASLCTVQGDLEDLLEMTPSFLTADEAAPLQQFHPTRQHSFLLGRYAAKQALAHFLACNLKDVALQQGFLGEPLVVPSKALISITHSGSFGIAVASDLPLMIGIDCEIRKNLEKHGPLKNDHPDVQYIQDCTSWDLLSSQGALWTAYESFGKYFKIGCFSLWDTLKINQLRYQHDELMISFKSFPQVMTTVVSCEPFLFSITIGTSIQIVKLKTLFPQADSLLSLGQHVALQA